LFLLINPDAVITKSALFSLIDFYIGHPDAGAIVPKLLLLRTPGFINGVGNIVPFFRWGYDLGLGHLDVGQFDDMLEVPSACFATVLIPREKWISVGELDEGYPMYYEDSDWSYRARGMGYKINMDINSRVFHSFNNSSKDFDMVNTKKLFDITYGRLRFITKLKPTIEFFLYLFTYFIFDICYVTYSLFKYKNGSKSFKAILSGWTKYITQITSKNYSMNKIKIIKTPITKYTRPRILNGFPYVKWDVLVNDIFLFTSHK